MNKKIGSLLIKKDLEVKIKEISKNEYEKVLKSLPQFKREELKEKVRVLADELIRFELNVKKVAVIAHVKEKNKLKPIIQEEHLPPRSKEQLIVENL